ncbi:MAG: helix-turn-helix transcriptional regulator [Bacteroidota bacterium]
MSIGKAIKSIRKKRSLSQAELARRISLSQTSLSQIETDAKRPSQRTIERLCKELDIPESVLYIAAMQYFEVPEKYKAAYDLILPSIRMLALQLVEPRHLPLTGTDE